MKKLIFVILDGAGDRAIKELGNKTTLESAKIPTLNRLASKGKLGLVDVLGGIAPESDVAVVTLLGYDPEKDYTGRGPLEAEGIGIEFKDGMLALRCNFATSPDGVILTDRRAGRIFSLKDAMTLADAINKKVKIPNCEFEFSPTVSHRAVLILKSKIHLSNKITNTDPAYANINGIPQALEKFEMRIKKSQALEDSKIAIYSANLLNDFTKKSYKVLKNHQLNKLRKKNKLPEANIILSRDAGNKRPKFQAINKKYNKKWAILADMPLEIGIGKLTGMRIIKMPPPTFSKVDYSKKIEALVKNLNKADCFYIHLKGTDIYGHDGNYNGKIKCFEDIDRYFFTPLLKILDKHTVLAVTADHCTPCNLKAHSGDPVPLLISGTNIKSDHLNGFNEKECLNGSLGVIRGQHLMDSLMEVQNSLGL